MSSQSAIATRVVVAMIGIMAFLVFAVALFASRLYGIWESFTVACFYSVDFVVRAFSYAGLGHMIGIAVLVLGLLWGVWYMAKQLYQNIQLKNRLLYDSVEFQQHVQKVYSSDMFAFTLGIAAPRVYISSGLIDALTEEELRAVIAHELQHVESADTLRAFFWSTISRLLYFLPIFWRVAEYQKLQREVAADRHAAQQTSAKILGRTLLKVWSCQHQPVAPQTVLGFAHIEQRVRYLMGEQAQPRIFTLRSGLVASLFAAALLLGIYVSPVQPVQAAAALGQTHVANCEPTPVLTEALESFEMEMHSESLPFDAAQ